MGRCHCHLGGNWRRNGVYVFACQPVSVGGCCWVVLAYGVCRWKCEWQSGWRWAVGVHGKLHAPLTRAKDIGHQATKSVHVSFENLCWFSSQQCIRQTTATILLGGTHEPTCTHTYVDSYAMNFPLDTWAITYTSGQDCSRAVLVGSWKIRRAC